ncbi:MAG: flagellar motor protein MotB, partial [Rhodocyclaceae bacterium]|nr:flagellar motor protein MotB [Rhodocyclaceae bacterium]
MSDDTQQPIIVKKIKKVVGGGHGGAWKIAYADFVTAMMAFFLLMWLLGSTAQGDLEGIADHFQNPLKVAMQGGAGTGDSSSVIPGGGEDLSRTVGQVRRGTVQGRDT